MKVLFCISSFLRGGGLIAVGPEAGSDEAMPLVVLCEAFKLNSPDVLIDMGPNIDLQLTHVITNMQISDPFEFGGAAHMRKDLWD